jgi:hypothetical protein
VFVNSGVLAIYCWLQRPKYGSSVTDVCPYCPCSSGGLRLAIAIYNFIFTVKIKTAVLHGSLLLLLSPLDVFRLNTKRVTGEPMS